MSEPARKRATYEDILALPPHRVGKILGGERVVSPRPAPRHAHAASVWGMDVGERFAGLAVAGGSWTNPNCTSAMTW